MTHITALTPYVHVGALTYVNTGGRRILVKVVKVNRTKYVSRAEDGLQYESRISHFKPAPEGTVFTEPYAPALEVYTHVAFKEGTELARKTPGLLFIIDHGRSVGSWKVAIVGSAGRFYRDVPAHTLVPVEVRVVV